MTSTLTDDQLLEPAAGIGQRADRFEFEVLDRDLVSLGKIEPMQESVARIDASTDRTIMRQLSGLAFHGDDANDIDPISHRLKPWCVLQNDSRFELGVYLFGDHAKQRLSAADVWRPTLYDQALILDNPSDRTIGVPAGANLPGHFARIAATLGFEHPILEAAAVAVSEPAAWAAGATRYEALAGLAARMGCYKPFFSNAGRLTAKAAADPVLATPDVRYPLRRIYVDTIIETNDSYRAPNRYMVLGSGQSPVVGIYDVPPAAPHSFAKRGFYVTERVDMPGIESASAAYAAARAAYLQDARTWETVTFATPLDPRLDLFSFVQYGDDADAPIYLEVGFTQELRSGGTHTHTLARIWQ